MKKTSTSRRGSDLTYLTRFMSGLHADETRLREIQGVYDNLTLLGQLLCAGTDITGMRNDFNALAGNLIEQLARELRKKAVASLSNDARVAIDILIRNLFERTADIGFLATDMEVSAFAEDVERDPSLARDRDRLAALTARFDEYVRKYSVYSNIILLAPDGKVLAQLDRHNKLQQSTDPLIEEALTTRAPYVETFRESDLAKGEDTPLIYAYRVMSADGSHPVGVLCLCFRFQDECRRIFDNLVAEDDWTVVTILDQDGHIVASSDIYQFPVGARLERVLDEDSRIVRFAGREYLATTRPTAGYQGYMGPGWVGHALAPLNHAFEMAEAHELEAVATELLDCVLEKATLFTPELRAIPTRAAAIQNELNRAVWNGHIWLSRDGYAFNASFAKVLLWEIGSTGVRTRNVFNESTTNLYRTVVSSALYDCGSQAALAIDVMDRNLYERANDCRWWALTPTFREELARGEPFDDARRQKLTDILRTINGLYTVYSNLILFDRNAKVVAVSNPGYSNLVGQTLSADWVRPTLALPDSQRYAVSSFTSTPLYDERPTYIYTAAVREPEGNEPVGGIAIVFDSAPQFAAMLDEALPRAEDGQLLPGAIAVFAERDGRIISSTDASLPPGSRLELGREFFELEQGAACTNIVTHNGRYYAVGSCMSAGYREYKAESDSYRNDVVALVLSPLSDATITPAELYALQDRVPETYTKRQTGGEDALEIATFTIGNGWYGVRSHFVQEAIEVEHITPVPGMPAWVSGCIVHDGQAITIFDLAGFLPGVENKSDSRQIVVIRSPDHHVSFGIRVDALGEIPEIAANRIEPVPAMMSTGNSLTESLVKPIPGMGDNRILVILSAERMLQRLTGLEFQREEGHPARLIRLPMRMGSE